MLSSSESTAAAHAGGVLTDLEQLVDVELRSTMPILRIDEHSEGPSDNLPSPTGYNRAFRKVSIFHAVFHIFKANVGAGVFLIPSFYNGTGAATGLAMATATGLIVLDSSLSLVEAKHRVDDERVNTYSEIVEHVLGKEARYYIDASLFFTQCGFCVLYLQFSCGLLASLMPFSGDYFFFLSLATAVVFPLTLLSDRLHMLAVASLLAAICVISVLCVAFFIAVTAIIAVQPSDATLTVGPTSLWLGFIAAHILALEGVGVILPVENAFSGCRSSFIGVIRSTLAAVIVLYTVFGVACYVAFGSTLSSSVIAALPPSLLAQACRFALATSLIFSYPIQFVPAIQIADRWFGSTSSDTSFILSRAGFNVLFGLTAASIGPGAINAVASFLGAFVGVHLTVFFPTLLSLVLDYQSDGGRLQLWTFRTLRQLGYLLFSIVVWIGGTAQCLAQWRG